MVRKKDSDVLPEDWSIEQETALFKAICRYKPVGLDKHFLMMCICQMVNNSNVEGPYLTTKSIWDKLSTLYNLDGLDELEDGSEESFSESAAETRSATPAITRHQQAERDAAKQERLEANEEANKRRYVPSQMKNEFSLPWDEYGELLLEHAREMDSQATSPAQLSTTAGASNTPVSTTRGFKRGREASVEEDLGSVDMNSADDINNLDSDKENLEEIEAEHDDEDGDKEANVKEEDEEEEVASRNTRRRGRTNVQEKTPEKSSVKARNRRTKPTKRGASGNRSTRQHGQETGTEEDEEEEGEEEHEEEEAHDHESGGSGAESEEPSTRSKTRRGRNTSNTAATTGTAKTYVPRRSSRQNRK
ncbi:chromatin modification-related protein EAF7-domain-containing protein [Lipomyces arxii]|uniref:chromatin modification-related protein EAF7-domain-containing protein n=1 Tax=Lipomyces arxii TaxID=56418 RepID=UPI0034CEE451